MSGVEATAAIGRHSQSSIPPVDATPDVAQILGCDCRETRFIQLNNRVECRAGRPHIDKFGVGSGHLVYCHSLEDSLVHKVIKAGPKKEREWKTVCRARKH